MNTAIISQPPFVTQSLESRQARPVKFRYPDPSSAYLELRRQQLLDRIERAASEDDENVVDGRAYEQAKSFARLLPPEALDADVVVEDDGEVAFDWGLSSRQTFSVSVGADGSLRYGGLFGFRTRHGTDQLSYAIPNDILAYIGEARAERLISAA